VLALRVVGRVSGGGVAAEEGLEFSAGDRAPLGSVFDRHGASGVVGDGEGRRVTLGASMQ